MIQSIQSIINILKAWYNKSQIILNNVKFGTSWDSAKEERVNIEKQMEIINNRSFETETWRFNGFYWKLKYEMEV